MASDPARYDSRVRAPMLPAFRDKGLPPSPSPARPSILQVAWQRYLTQLNKRPLRTKAVTAACIAGLSDIIAQRMLFGGYRSPRRTFLCASYGLLWNGPSAHYWQKFVETLFMGKRDLVTVLKKVVLDQTTYGPICNVLFMSFATLLLEGRSVSALRAKISRDYVSVQLNGWKLWPIAALINYQFVPLKFRVLFINVVALVWSTFLLLRSRSAAGNK